MNSLRKALATGLIVSLGMSASIAMADVVLLHRYSFNDGTAADSVGQSNGKLMNGVLISGGSAHFTGESKQRIELPANGPGGININTLKAVTLEAWYTADKALGWQRVFDFGASKGLDSTGTTGSNCINYIVTTGSKTQPMTEATFSNSDPSFTEEAAAETKPAPLNQEVHVAVVADGRTLTLYLNGAQVAQAPLESRTLSKISNDYALLGQSLYGDNPSFSGAINEFRIYSGAASAAEVAASFKAGADHPVIGTSK